MKFNRVLCALTAATLVFSVSAHAGGSMPQESDDEAIYQTSAKAPSVSAVAACLIEDESGDIVFGVNSHERMMIASTTKIMTAIVAIENYSLQRVIKVSASAVGIEGSSVYLCKDERLTAEQLLYALLLESANDAACALAIEVGGNEQRFVEMMNDKAQELGLKDTNFTNPHGLPADGHYSSAYDMARLLSYCMRNESFRKITSTRKMTLPGADGTYSRLLINHNRLLSSYSGIIGGKTGFTKASGRCLVSCCERDGVRLICVTLNAPSDWADHAEMYDYGFMLYENITLEEPGQSVYDASVCGGTDTTVRGELSDKISVTLPKERGEIKKTVMMRRFYYPAVSRGEIIGYVLYECGGRRLCKSPIYAQNTVLKTEREQSVWDKIIGFFRGN